MDSARHIEGVDDYAVALIHRKAEQLIRKVEFRGMDLEDLEQEMTLDLLHRLPQYDPARASRHTFIARVVEHKVATLLAFQRVPRRNAGAPVQALREDANDAAGGRGGQVHSLDEAAWKRRIGGTARLEEERLDERLDIETVIDRLPEDLRQLACQLRSKTPWEISKETGIPRTSVYRALERLRERFREAGLEEIPWVGGRSDENAGK